MSRAERTVREVGEEGHEPEGDRSDAEARFQYVTHIHVMPMPKNEPEITGEIQCVLLAVHANRNKEIWSPR